MDAFAGGGKLDENYDIISANGFDSELEVIDLLIADASSAIDAGEYLAALEGFREALRLAKSTFGDNVEIEELGKAINDIEELLDT